MLAVVTSQRSAESPWLALRCVGDPALRVIPSLKQLGIETYYPVVREMHRVPRRRLSHAQRSSGAVLMRPRVVSFLTGTVFVRGQPFGSESRELNRPLNLKIGDQVAPAVPRALDWKEVFELPSIVGFHAIGEVPAAFSFEVIAELRAREVGGVIAGRTPARMIFKVGDRVRVTQGPFTTSIGIIEQVPDVAIEDIDADTRLKLAIDIFGRATPVELSAWQIEKV